MLIKSQNWNAKQGTYQILRFKADKPYAICICGRKKQDPNRRYCQDCQRHHGLKMHLTHVGKGRGPRIRRVKKPVTLHSL